MLFISFSVRNCLVLASLIILFLGSCVSSKKYSDMEVLKEYYKLKGDTLLMVKNDNQALGQERNQLISELNLTKARLAATQEALDLAEEKYENLNREYAALQANAQKLSATQKLELESTKGRVQQLQKQNETMKNILADLDNAYQIHLNGSISSSNNWNDRLSRMQEIAEVIDAERSQLNGLFQVLASSAIFQEEGFDVFQSAKGITIRLLVDKIFREGKSQLNTKGRNTIAELSGVIVRNSNLDVIVEGHTDGVGSETGNWNMSSLRATAVVKQMVKSEMRPSRVQAIGRSSHFKVDFEDTPKARKNNRRIEIIIQPRTYR